jgi:hypothetical protein
MPSSKRSGGEQARRGDFSGAGWWLATCKFADPEVRTRVSAGADLLATVQAEGVRIIDAMTARAAMGK